MNSSTRPHRKSSGQVKLLALSGASFFSLALTSGLALLSRPDHGAPAQAPGGLLGATNGLAARTLHAPTIDGLVVGDVHQQLPASVRFNSIARLQGNFLLPGTPSLTINGQVSFLGTLHGQGNPQPSSHNVLLNAGAQIRHLVVRTDPTTPFDPVPDTASPSGNRTVTLNPGDPLSKIGPWHTLRHLTLNSGAPMVAVPPGAYGKFKASPGSAGFILGQSNLTSRSVYHFEELLLNSRTTLRILSPVEIRVKTGFIMNDQVVAGHQPFPDWLLIRTPTQNGTVNSAGTLYGLVEVPRGTVVIDAGGLIEGQVIACDRLIVNSQGTLRYRRGSHPCDFSAIPGLKLWLDAATGVSQQNGKVAQWLDQSGHNNHASQNNSNKRPILTTNACSPCATPTIRFDGKNDRLDFAPIDTPAFTTFVVMRLTELNPHAGPLSNRQPGLHGFQITTCRQGEHGAEHKEFYHPHLVVYDGADEFGVGSATPLAMPTACHVHTWSSSTNGQAFFLDGLLQTLTNGCNGWGNARASVGFSFSYVGADISEVLIFDRILTPAERQTVLNCLNTKYCLQPNLPPTAQILRPLPGSAISACDSLEIEAAAADPDGSIRRVDFFDGDLLLATRTNAPFRVLVPNLAPGERLLTVLATDDRGAATRSQPVPIFVSSNRPPTVAITQPAGPLTLEPGTPVEFRASASDPDAPLTQIEWRIDGQLAAALAPATPFLWSTNRPGTYSVTATVHDACDVTAVSDPLLISIAAAVQPPTVAWLSPAPDADLAPCDPIALLVTAADPDGAVVRVDLFDGATGIASLTEPPYSFTWTPTSGEHTLRAVATDNDGLLAEAFLNVSVASNAPPSVAWLAPATNLTVHTLGAPIPLELLVTDPDANLAQTSLLANGLPLATFAAPPHTFTWIDAPLGTNLLSAIATDRCGVTATNLRTLVVVPPHQPPFVQIVTPTNNQLVGACEPLTVEAIAHASNGASIVSVDLFLDDLPPLTFSAAPYRFVWTNAAPGPHAVRARAADSRGATNLSAPISFWTATNRAPALHWVSPTNQPAFLLGQPIPLQVDASDPDADPLTVAFFYQHTNFIAQATNAPFLTVWTNATLGSNALTAIATDLCGLSVTSRVEAIWVQPTNAPPSVQWLSPDPRSIAFVDCSTVVLAARAADPDGSVTNLSISSGSTLLGATNGPVLELSWSPALGAAASLVAVARDNRGASASVTLTVRLATNQAPTVAFQQPQPGASVAFGDPVSIAISGSDPDLNLNSVALYHGSSLLTTFAAPPYAFVWTPTNSGVAVLRVIASDACGSSATSSVPVTVLSPNAPSISLSPPTGSHFPTCSAITLRADVDDPAQAVDQVELFVDDTLVATIPNPPYSLLWTPPYSGSFTFRARARLADGTSIDSDPSVVRFSVNQPASLLFTEPEVGVVHTVGQPIQFVVRATDPDDVNVRVELRQGSNSIGHADAPPYVGQFTPPAPGEYVVEAECFDSCGGSGAPVPFAFLVLATNQLPKISITAPPAGFSSLPCDPVLIEASVLDEGDIATVEFFADGEQIGSDVTAPYSMIWRAPSPGKHSITARVQDVQGAATVSSPVEITILESGSSRVRLVSPRASDGIMSSYELRAEIDGPEQPSRVEFFEGTNLIAFATNLPFAAQWDVPPDEEGRTVRFLARAHFECSDPTNSTPVEIGSNGLIISTTFCGFSDEPTFFDDEPIPFHVGAAIGLPDEERLRSEVRVYADGNFIGRAVDRGFSVLCDEPFNEYYLEWPAGPGRYSVTVRIVLDGEVLHTSESITLTILPSQPRPTVRLLSPVNRSVVPLPTQMVLSAEAQTDDPSATIASVAFYRKGLSNAIAEVTSPPFTHVWTDVPAGFHRITAVARDSRNRRATSEPVDVLVEGPTPTDLDGDGMPDRFEYDHFLDPTEDDALLDSDRDRFPNVFEFFHGTSPTNALSVPTPDAVVDASGFAGFTRIQPALDAITNAYAIIQVNPGRYDTILDVQTFPRIVTIRDSRFGTERIEVTITEVSSGVRLSGSPRMLFAWAGPNLTTIDAGGSIAPAVELSASTAVLDGFTIQNGAGIDRWDTLRKAGGILDSSGRSRIANCIVQNNAGTGLRSVAIGPQRSGIVDACVFRNNRNPSGWRSLPDWGTDIGRFERLNPGEGGGASLDATAPGLRIQNSFFYGNAAYLGSGIDIPTSRLPFHPDIVDRIAIVNCSILNNLRVDEDHFGQELRLADTLSVHVLNSLIWNSSFQLIPLLSLSPFDLPRIDHSAVQYLEFQEHQGTGNLFIDDPDVEVDGRLRPSSPLVDAGRLAGATGHDYDGQLRSAGTAPDIGADELSSAPTLLDSDNDGMEDAWEIIHFGDLSRDGSGDFDSDQISDLNEFLLGLDPTSADSDRDQLNDGLEILVHRTDPLNPDTDGDGLLDGEDVAYALDPLANDSLSDSDRDSVPTLYEARRGHDPLDPADAPSADWTVSADLSRAQIATIFQSIAIDYAIVEFEPGVYAHPISLGNAFNAEINTPRPVLIRSKQGAARTVLGDIVSLNGRSVIAGFTFRLQADRPGIRLGVEAQPRVDSCVFLTGQAALAYFGFQARAEFVNCTVLNLPASITPRYDNEVRWLNSILWNPGGTLFGSINDAPTLLHCIVSDSQLSGSNLVSELGPIRSDGHIGRGSGARNLALAPLSSARDMDLEEVSPLEADIGADQFVDDNANGLADWWEALFPAATLHQDGDFDGDGLTDEREFYVRSDPTNEDTDQDGLSDSAEVDVHSTDPTARDTDRDEMPDGWEVLHGSDPVRFNPVDDQDLDRIPNLWEFAHGSHPTNAASYPQNVWVVDPSGAGTHTTISAALAAAQTNFSIVRVRPGVYKEYLRVHAARILLLGDEPTEVILDGDLPAVPSSCPDPAVCERQIVKGGLSMDIDNRASGSVVDGLWFRNGRRPWVSYFTSATDPSIRQAGELGAALKIRTGITNVTVANCLFSGCDESEGSVLYLDARTELNLRHCTIFNNAHTPDSPSPIRSFGRLNAANSIILTESRAPASIVARQCLVSHGRLLSLNSPPGSVIGDPLLRSDGHIIASSIARDAGQLGADRSRDFDREARPADAAPDIGCDEFVSVDGDPLPDWWEIATFGSLTQSDGSGDQDQDGMTDKTEYEHETDPTLWNGVQNVALAPVPISRLAENRTLHVSFDAFQALDVEVRFYAFNYSLDPVENTLAQPQFHLITAIGRTLEPGRHSVAWDGLDPATGAFHTNEVIKVEIQSTSLADGRSEIFAPNSDFVPRFVPYRLEYRALLNGGGSPWFNEAAFARIFPSLEPCILHNFRIPVVQRQLMFGTALELDDWIPYSTDGTIAPQFGDFFVDTFQSRSIPELCALYTDQRAQIHDYTVEAHWHSPLNHAVVQAQFRTPYPCRATLTLVDPAGRETPLYYRSSEGPLQRAEEVELSGGTHQFEFFVRDYSAGLNPQSNLFPIPPRASDTIYYRLRFDIFDPVRQHRLLRWATVGIRL